MKSKKPKGELVVLNGGASESRNLDSGFTKRDAFEALDPIDLPLGEIEACKDCLFRVPLDSEEAAYLLNQLARHAEDARKAFRGAWEALVQRGAAS